MGFDRNRGANAGNDGFLVGLGGFQGVDSLAERGAGLAVRLDERRQSRRRGRPGYGGRQDGERRRGSRTGASAARRVLWPSAGMAPPAAEAVGFDMG